MVYEAGGATQEGTQRQTILREGGEDLSDLQAGAVEGILPPEQEESSPKKSGLVQTEPGEAPSVPEKVSTTEADLNGALTDVEWRHILADFEDEEGTL